MPEIVSLRAGDLALDVAPAVGGAIAAFRCGDIALMRETPPEAIEQRQVRLTCCFPMFPYSNRIDRGRFAFGGETHALALNFGDHPHAIHGNAWQSAWTVERVRQGFARLAFRHDPADSGAEGWPFAFAAFQHFAVDGDGLTIGLAIENLDDRPFPAGMGLHPFFPRRPGATLRFRADGVWRNGADWLPSSLEPVPPEWDFADAKPVGEAFVDNCFAGWDGTAEIAFPDAGLRVVLAADRSIGHLVVFVPDGRDFFAVEPVTHMNDAVSRMGDVSGHGLVVLEPGERLAGSVRFTVEPIR